MTTPHPTTPGSGKSLQPVSFGKTFLPLMAVQQRRRDIGYQMPIPDRGSASEATAVSYAARERLRRGPVALPSPKMVIASKIKPPEPVFVEPEPVEVQGAPINMLLPCSWRFLIRLTALRHGVSDADILSRSRRRPLTLVRHEAVYLVAQHTDFSLPKIGSLFGRDHTTILHSLRRYPSLGRGNLYARRRAAALEAGRYQAILDEPAIVSEPVVKGVIDELREEIRQLRSEIGSEPDRQFQSAASRVFGMSPSQSRIFQMLMTGRVQTTASLLAACSPGYLATTEQCLKVQIYKLRRALAPHDIGVINEFAIGYSILKADRERAAALMLA